MRLLWRADTTSSIEQNRPRGSTQKAGWALCVALDRRRVGDSSARVVLDEQRAVEVGRGDGPKGDDASLRVDLRDRAASQVHFRLQLDGDEWTLTDAHADGPAMVDLDHMLVHDERHLQRVLDQYRKYFNSARPHQGIGQRRPMAFAQDARAATAVPVRKVVAQPVLDGLHHDYRIAA